jgi:hypothetical protein
VLKKSGKLAIAEIRHGRAYAGELEIGKGHFVVRLDRDVKVVEIIRPGDPSYGDCLGLVGPVPDDDRAGGGPGIVLTAC